MGAVIRGETDPGLRAAAAVLGELYEGRSFQLLVPCDGRLSWHLYRSSVDPGPAVLPDLGVDVVLRDDTGSGG